MPRAAWKPATSSASVNGRARITSRPWRRGRDRLVGGEDDLALGGAGRGGDAAGEHLEAGLGVERRVQQRVERAGVDRPQRLLGREQALVDRVDGEAHGGLRRALGAARLQHVQAAALDGELGVLHVAVVRLERAQDLEQLRVARPGSSSASSCSGRGVRTPETTSSPCASSRKSPLGSGAPVTSSRENATPVAEPAPRLPNTICWTLTAVPQSSGMWLMRR